MKRIAALLLALTLLCLLAACGKKSTCPICSAEADFSTQVYCSSCGYDFGSMKPDGYYEEQPTPEELAIYELTGVWQTSDWWETFTESGILWREFFIFFPNGEGLLYRPYSDDNEIYYISYSLNDGILTLSDKNGEWAEDEWFNYKIEDGILLLDDQTFSRISTYASDGLLGTWAVLSGGDIQIDNTTYSVGTVDFYQDGTYQFNKGVSGGTYVDHTGYYQLVHDGTAIVFDGNIDAPFTFTLLGDGVMTVSDPFTYNDMLFVCTGNN